jgi:hypothetical protein
MPNPFYATVTAPGATTIWQADYSVAPFNANVQVFVPAGTTVSYEVDFSLDDVNLSYQNLPPQEWMALATFPAGSTISITSAVQAPVAALRLNVASISGGPVYFKILQGGFIGT